MAEGLLDALAAEAPIETESVDSTRTADGSFDLDAWIKKHFVDARLKKDAGDARVWELPTCPWNEAHKGSAFIKQWPNGRIGAGCHHNSCNGKGWHDLRDAVEPGWRDRSKSTTTSKKKRSFVDVEAYVPFPVDVLPEPVRGFIKAAAKALGCDEAYVALALIVSLASAVGTTRRIRLKRTWNEPLILWAGIVGESGTLKSPALDLATAFLRRKQDEAFARYSEDVANYERDEQLYEADFAEWKKSGRRKGEPAPEKPSPPVCQRYMADDTTVEGLADRLQHAPRGLLTMRDELAGWVLSFNQYKARGGADVANWLKIHAARPLLIDRKSGVYKTIYIPRAGVSVLGGVQPGILRRVLTSEHFESGLSARLLLAMPPAPAKRWTEATVDAATEEALDFVFDRLLALDFATDDGGQAVPVDLELTVDGRAAWRQFYNEHAEEQVNLSGDLAAAWSKLEGYAARFALLAHLLRWAGDDPTLSNKNAVDAASVEAGAKLARWFGTEARRIYGMLGDDSDTADLRRTVDLIRRKGGQITVRELQQSDRRFASAEDAEAELKQLADAKIGTWDVDNTPSGRGPIKRVFRLSTPSTVYRFAENPEENAKPVDVDSVDTTKIDSINSLLAAPEEVEGGDQWRF